MGALQGQTPDADKSNLLKRRIGARASRRGNTHAPLDERAASVRAPKWAVRVPARVSHG